MTFGNPVDQATAIRMVDRAIDAGINFFDTANAYQLGQSEIMLGNAIRGRRDRLILASKVFHKMGEGPDEGGLSKAAILRAVDDSLRRLQTDYLDLYYLHQPDYSVPVEESLEAMETLVQAGKIRYPASSNYAAWQVCQMFCLAEKKNRQAPTVAQMMYNLLARGLEQEFLPMAKELGVSTIVYNPLAAGLLTGKHSAEAPTPGTRFASSELYQKRYWHKADFHAVEQLKKAASSAGRSPTSIALNWLLCHTPVDCIIFGATRLEQLEENVQACGEGPLAPETLAAVDQIWKEFRGPVPYYNR
jgi:aryl-alcohol dehydrogenase-like predicted oxidoreductase